MAYRRWSNSPFYIFQHAGFPDNEPHVALWPSDATGVYDEEQIRDLIDALNAWLEDVELDRE